jgi:adenine-specific DNA-methyltransferase
MVRRHPETHAAWWGARIERQRRIEASIERRADIEYLYDRPYEDRSRIRVAGPFTVESLSPHRVVPADEDELFAQSSAPGRRRKTATPPIDFAAMMLDHLRTATDVPPPHRRLRWICARRPPAKG